MKKLKEIILYLSGPMAGCTDEECHGWRDEVKKYFPCSLDPTRRDYRNKDVSKLYREIVELDKMDIRNSDVLLVNYFKPSVGTSMEILYSSEKEKPVIIWCNEDAILSPWLIYHSTTIVHTLDEVIEKIGKIL